MRKGYITVFLTLSLTLILSLVFTVIEGARISAIRMKFECVADIGMNSVLAEYHRELLEQYELLFVDMSYGGRYGMFGKFNLVFLWRDLAGTVMDTCRSAVVYNDHRYSDWPTVL